jgi:CBS domain-containing protein
MVGDLSAGDICTRSVVFAHRKMAVDDAARLMREHHVGALVVVDETDAGRLVAGVLTDRDIVTGIVAKGLDPKTIAVEDAMSADLVTAREGDSIVDLLGTMRRKGVRRIPVVDGVGRLVGIVALDDVLEIVARQVQLMAQAIDSGRKREPAIRP